MITIDKPPIEPINEKYKIIIRQIIKEELREALGVTLKIRYSKEFIEKHLPKMHEQSIDREKMMNDIRTNIANKKNKQ